jgi:hypothetical protein
MKTKKLNLQNVDLRHVRGGILQPVNAFIVRTANTAFTAPGITLFVVGVVFGLGVIARH